MMQFTGERMVPGTAGRDELFFEHIVRYAFAARYAPGLRALDAGCGCGYGAHFLRRAGAAEVLGVDIDPASIDFSRRHFAHDDLRFAVGDVLSLPVADQSYDLITCFEVFEHVEGPESLLAELRRILRPGGVMVVSTPNALTYQPDTEDGANPFHVREYEPGEWRELLTRQFEHVELFVQNPFGGMGIFPMDRPADSSAQLEVLSPPQESLWGEPREIHAAGEKCAYLIACCGAAEARSKTSLGVSRPGQIFAMAGDLSDTTAERSELNAYVDQLAQEYALLKDEQATSTEWAQGVLEQLSQAKNEIELLKTAKATLEAERKALKAASRATRESEEKTRLEAEARGRELDKAAAEAEKVRGALEEAGKWARQLESELERNQEELSKVRQAHAEHERQMEEAAAWAHGLEQQLQDARAALEQASDHEQKVRVWSEELSARLEAAEAGRPVEQEQAPSDVETHLPPTSERESQLEEQLLAKDQRLAQVEAAHADLERHERELSAWAKQQAEQLAEAESALEELRGHLVDKEKSEEESGSWARGLESELKKAQDEIQRLHDYVAKEQAEREKIDRESAEWGRNLEKTLAELQAENERLRAGNTDAENTDAQNTDAQNTDAQNTDAQNDGASRGLGEESGRKRGEETGEEPREEPREEIAVEVAQGEETA